MTLWSALLIATLVAAAAQDPSSGAEVPAPVGPTAADAPPPPPPRRADLEAAVRAYQAGRHAEARVALAMMVNDPTLTDQKLRMQARVYLGEIFYVEGDEEAAFKAFEAVLSEDPNFRIDPFRHPPDVCGFFEVVRASTTPGRATPLVTPPPPGLAANAWMGFGQYQRTHGERTHGRLLLGGQLVTGAVSLVSYGVLLADREYADDDPEKKRHLQRLRLLQWGATTGFWGIYAWGMVDAQRDHAAEQRVGAGVRGTF